MVRITAEQEFACIKEIAKDNLLKLTTYVPYQIKLICCWQCTAQTIVWKTRCPENCNMWCDHRPPDPIPPNLRFTYTKTSNQSYWANFCFTCKAIQGDYYIRDGGRYYTSWYSCQDISTLDVSSVDVSSITAKHIVNDGYCAFSGLDFKPLRERKKPEGKEDYPVQQDLF